LDIQCPVLKDAGRTNIQANYKAEDTDIPKGQPRSNVSGPYAQLTLLNRPEYETDAADSVQELN
jgi:hypothetical protein